MFHRYEGTGRSLSLKLIQKLRDQNSQVKGASSGRQLKEVTLEEPIRYAPGDEVESWMNNLLCLDAVNHAPPPLVSGCPAVSDCQLYYVNRDTLFSYHKLSEEFLQRIMSLFVASHYKNSPNDLQLMSDAPAHHIFVLLGPVTDTSRMPDILAAIHVAFEGAISREAVLRSIGRGKMAAGDLIPWTLSQQFQDSDFPSLSGARVVRIATHPGMQKMGYGSRALELLAQYFLGNIQSVNEEDDDDGDEEMAEEIAEEAPAAAVAAAKEEEDLPADSEATNDLSDKLHTEKIAPRKNLPPLLVPLDQRPAEQLHWLGVAFGLSPSLFAFWRRSKYTPVYLRMTPNDITGEHSCIMMRTLRDDALGVTSGEGWLDAFADDFRHRFTALLGYEFSKLHVMLPTDMLIPSIAQATRDTGLCTKELTADQIEYIGHTFSQYDRRRLDSYAKNLVDYHVILDLVPRIATLVFTGLVPIPFTAHQYVTLVGLGLQRKRVEVIAKELNIEVNQLLANFNKAMRKIAKWLRDQAESEVAKEIALPPPDAQTDKPIVANALDVDLNADLADGAKKTMAEMTKSIAQMSASETIAEMKEDIGDAEDGTMKERQEKLAKMLGVSHFKIQESSGNALEESAARLHGAVPNIMSFKIGEKKVESKKRREPPKGGKPPKHKRR